jgi:glycosyltransferase involved in cell wall biosynthesis
MRVLFLLSCLEPAGSETYCLSLARAWQDRHTIFWISDKLHFGQSYTSFPIHAKAFPGGIANTLRVAAFIREHQIDLVHSHSRRAHWVAAQAAALTGVPHITTIHQPPPVHLFSRLFPCLGDHTIAIDEVVQEHLQKYFRRGIKRISLIRNGIELQPPLPRQAGGDRRVLILGRMTGGRWRTLQFLFNVLKRSGKSLPKTCFQLVGRIPEERREELAAELKAINQALAPGWIETHDFVSDLRPLIASSQGVIAGGRSALESLAQEKPVIAMGEKVVVGLCNADNWAEARRTNLGDHLIGAPDAFYPAKLEISLRELLGDSLDPGLGRWGRRQVETDYNIRNVADAVDAVYQDALDTGKQKRLR